MAIRVGCQCREGWIAVYDGGALVGKKKAPPVHDCEYIKKRNALMSGAVAKANHERRSDESWASAFGRAMNALVQERVLCR